MKELIYITVELYLGDLFLNKYFPTINLFLRSLFHASVIYFSKPYFSSPFFLAALLIPGIPPF